MSYFALRSHVFSSTFDIMDVNRYKLILTPEGTVVMVDDKLLLFETQSKMLVHFLGITFHVNEGTVTKLIFDCSY